MNTQQTLFDDISRKYNHQSSELPYVLLKVAQTIDGNIAPLKGEKTWIGGEIEKQYCHFLRDKYDAVLIGAKTVIANNPSLISNLTKKAPYRIIFDKHLETSLDAKIYNDEFKDRTIIITSFDVNHEKLLAFQNQGIELLTFKLNKQKHFDLNLILLELKKHDIDSIMVEGGSKIWSSFIQQKVANEIQYTIVPIILGLATPNFNSLGILSLDEGIDLTSSKIYHLGSDVLFKSKL